MSKTGYITYIDEAGDFGLRRIAPIDRPGASEWFVMGAIVIRKQNEAKIAEWLSIIREKANNTQPADLHFRKLSARQKTLICNEVAKLPMRLFVYISNKQNMRGHNNAYARKVATHKHWFYWWAARLLLERVTDFCAEHNKKNGTSDLRLQLEFSRRKDLRRHDFTDYFTRLWNQGKNVYLPKRKINWPVFDFDNVHFYDHQSRAGLQFADVLASSFFQAINIHPHGKCFPEYATSLSPLIYRTADGIAYDEGFTVWPQSLRKVDLSEDQKVVFKHYGMPESLIT